MQYKRWINADFIFANATAFSDEMLIKVSQVWENEGKKGSIFMWTTKELKLNNEDNFKWFKPFKKQMSWGPTWVRACQKLTQGSC